jgi:alpha-beta hydrolase superfamily lysophospholipase
MQKLSLLILSVLVSIFVSAQAVIVEEPAVLQTATGDIFGTLRVPPAAEAVPVVLIIAGSGPTDRNGNNPQMQNNSLKMLAESLFHNGIASLAFDKRGIAESAGSAISEVDLRFEDFINDVRKWVDLLADDTRFSEVIVAGHSEGALIGKVAAQNNANVARVISIAGAGVSAGDILREQLSAQLAGQQAVEELLFSFIDQLENGETVENVPPMFYALFRSSVQPYLISWFRYNPQTEIAKLQIPILIVQGTTDIQVSVQQAELLATAQPNAQKVIIENMNHVLKNIDTTDIMSQMATYTNPNLPINNELVERIVEFVFF